MRQVENNQNNHNSDLLLEVKDFYNNIVDDTVELMNLYNCKTPIEVYCLFNKINDYYVNENELFKLLYLKMPTYSTDLEDADIQGIQVLLNGGVCRHRSAMLSDIYNKMGIDSVVLVGLSESLLTFSNTKKISLNKQFHNQMYIKELQERLSKGEKLDNFKSQLKEKNISYHIKDVHDGYYIRKSLLYHNSGMLNRVVNHAIVMAGDNKRYYLDPSLKTIYYRDDNDYFTLKNNMGLYFFLNIKCSQYYWKDMKDKNTIIFDNIHNKSSALEKEVIRDIKNINMYLNNYKNNIEEFAKSNANSIENIKKKCLSLSKE